MISSIFAPVFAHKSHVQVPVRDSGLTAIELLKCPFAQGQRSDSGGQPRHFCDPLYANVPCHLSRNTGTPARLVTVSNNKSAPNSRQSFPMPCIG